MPSVKTARAKVDYRYPVMLVALILLMVVIMEFSHPYFFLQDDNRTLYLPFYLHNLRALLGGEFPFYNFHQYLGTPVTIQYAALYPVNYLALSLSKLLLGSYFGTMEIIAGFHLLVAALGFFSLMRSFELEEVSCFFGALAWTFCGFVITVGNSWIQTVGFAAYLPWILLFSIRQLYRFDGRCFLILVVLKIGELLLGYPQLFIYTLTFEFLTVVLLFVVKRRAAAGSLSTGDAAIDNPLSPSPTFAKVMASFFANYAVVFIISLPLIVQTLYQATVSANRKQLLSWEEYAAYSYNLSYWFNGLLAPFKAVDITTQFDLHFISHVGYLTILFVIMAVTPLGKSAAGLLDSSADVGTRRRQVLVFAVLALLSLLWAGDMIITRILYHLPVYNRMRFPFKVAFFTSFYLAMIATFGFNAFYGKVRSVKGVSRNIVTIIVGLILILHTANFLVLYAVLPQQMFSRHLDQIPLVEPLREQLADGRIVSASLDEVWDGDKIVPGFSAPLIGYDYATLWGLFHFGGYDPMVSAKAQAAALGIKNNPVFNLPANEPFSMPSETLEYFRRWGVKWYIVNKAIPLKEDDVFKLYKSDDHRNVLLDSLAKPLVYWLNKQDSGKIDYRFKTNSIKVDCETATGGTLILNVLRHPFFSARLDGKELSITETVDNQVSLSVPKGRHTVLLKYTDHYFLYASIVSAAFIVLLLPVLLFTRAKTAINKFMS